MVTPLGYAVNQNKPQMVACLCAASVDVNCGGNTALDLALYNESEECAKILLSHNASLSATYETELSTEDRVWLARIRKLVELERQQEIDGKQQLIWKWMEEDNFEQLRACLSTLQGNDVKELMVSGRLPLEGWHQLLTRSSSAREKEPSLLEQSAGIEARINSLKLELADLQSKQAQLREELEQSSQLIQLEPLVKEYADCELELVGEFQEKISSPDWNADLMSWNDLTIALHKFHIPQWIPRLSASDFIQKNVELLLYTDSGSLSDEFPEVELNEKLDLFYVADMISSNRLDFGKHKEQCAVCSSESVELSLREQGVSKELFEKIADRVRGLKLHQLIFCPVNLLAEGLNLDGISKGKIAKALLFIKQIHVAIQI